MAEFIDEAFWKKSLSKPDWYLWLADDFRRLEKLAAQDKNKNKGIKREAYKAVESAVKEGRIILAESGDSFDEEREPIDRVVIHHTKNQPGMTLDRLNAMQLLRIYGMYFANPTNPNEQHLKGRPIWSGHFYQEQQVFWCYHWLITEDGTVERILKDEYIGWHAGNWDINKRSIAICIDDNLTDKEPSEVVVNAITRIIREHYPTIKPDNIVGHCDANQKTECPGYLFHQSWQAKLLKHVS